MKELFARTRSILRRHFGDRISDVKPRSGSTDCNVPLSLGIPAVCYGCYLGGGAHTYAEYVEMSSIRAGLSVALDTLLAMANKQ
jgi:di/tripeptidase